MPSVAAARVIRFWKPYNVLTQFTDPEGRSTLADYISVPNVYATGRLDMDSEGLLVLTDSALLKTRLTEPMYAHPRTYHVQVERIPDENALQQLRLGIQLNDGFTRPAQVQLLHDEPNFPPRPIPIRFRKNVPTAWLRMTLTEGRNRQVRRMTAAIGHPTLRLIRTNISTVTLDGLHPGEWRDLTTDERNQLWQAVMPG
jgi:23S rRNA pseudouridine2457 synthase